MIVIYLSHWSNKNDHLLISKTWLHVFERIQVFAVVWGSHTEVVYSKFGRTMDL